MFISYNHTVVRRPLWEGARGDVYTNRTVGFVVGGGVVDIIVCAPRTAVNKEISMDGG